MNVQSLQIKLFIDTSDFDLDLDVLIPIFHRWIQKKVLTETLLIDVADYRHVHNGPGVMLIGHDVHLGIDCAAGRPGLVYAFKRDKPGAAGEKLDVLFAGALNVCALLEKESVFGGKLRFRTDELQVGAMSRLLMPNTKAIFDEFTPHLRSYGEKLFAGGDLEIALLQPDPAPFTVALRTGESNSVSALQSRLGPSLAL